MIAILALLKRIPIVYAVVAISLGAALVAGKMALHFHDVSVLSNAALEVSEETRAAEAANHARSVVALESVTKDAATRVSRTTPIRKNVNAAPRTNACANSPAVRAALDGLRVPHPSGSRPATRPAKPADVRAATRRP